MKLILASLTAATLLASAASAMTSHVQVDPRDAAQNPLGEATVGMKSTIMTSQAYLDGRSTATIGTGEFNVYTFEANNAVAEAHERR